MTDASRADQSTVHGPLDAVFPRLSLHISERKILLAAGDAGCWLLVLAGVGARFHFSTFLIATFVSALALWWLLCWANGGYDVETAARLSLVLPAISRAAVSVVLCVTAIGLLSRGSVGRIGWTVSVVAVFGALVAWRVCYLKLFTLPMFARRLLFAGVDPLGTQLAEAIRGNWSPELSVVGFVTGEGAIDDRTHDVGEVGGVLTTAKALKVSEVVASPRAIEHPGNVALLVDCANAGFKVTPSPLLYENLFRRVPVGHVDPRWMLAVAEGAFPDRTFLGTKRMIDLLLAGADD